jgi:hypothetical protein
MAKSALQIFGSCVGLMSKSLLIMKRRVKVLSYPVKSLFTLDRTNGIDIPISRLLQYPFMPISILRYAVRIIGIF